MLARFVDFFKAPSVAHSPVQNFNGGAQCSRDETWGFHQRVKGWMDSTSWIPNYFPFGQLSCTRHENDMLKDSGFFTGAFREMQGVNPFNQLMNQDGSPTALGYMYIG
jgi:hypothetical protein